jgi:hypothetical protein
MISARLIVAPHPTLILTGCPRGLSLMGCSATSCNHAGAVDYPSTIPLPEWASARAESSRRRLDAGAPVRDSKQTVGEWLAYWRTTGLAASDRKESTRELHTRLSQKHLEPAPFGAIRLDKLKPSHIDTLVLEMKARTKPAKGEDCDPRRAFSDSTVRQVYTVLRAGLDGAVRDGLIARNPGAQVTRPSVERHEALLQF